MGMYCVHCTEQLACFHHLLCENCQLSLFVVDETITMVLNVLILHMK